MKNINIPVFSITHSWEDSPAGLLVTTKQVVGLEDPGTFSLNLVRSVNAGIKTVYSRGEDFNMVLPKFIEHNIEVMGRGLHRDNALDCEDLSR